MAGVITWLYVHTPIPDDVAIAAQQQSSTVYFADGKTPIGTFSAGTNRQLLQSNQIPKVLKDAVIAAEDRNFWTEGGISPTGILRAFYQDATGGQFQGGSTITQQFARNYYANIGTEQTYSRKLKEIFVAIKLSHTKSKDWILTQYLNTIFLGDNAYGVGAASQTYFDKPAMKLNAAQAAMLAAMINQPGFFDPHPGTEGYQPLVARWHYVLGNMVRDGALTQAQADSMKFPKLKHSKQASGWTGFRGYIMQAVETEMQTRYGIYQGPAVQPRAAHHDHDQPGHDEAAVQVDRRGEGGDGGRRPGAARLRAHRGRARGPEHRRDHRVVRRPQLQHEAQGL